MATRTIASRLYQIGETVVDAPQNTLRRFTSYRISCTRENWPAGVDCVMENGVVEPNIALQIIFERSNDDGKTWETAGGATFPGGAVFSRDGTESLESFIAFAMEDALTKQRVVQSSLLRVRAKRLVPLRTSVTVEVGDA